MPLEPGMRRTRHQAIKQNGNDRGNINENLAKIPSKVIPSKVSLKGSTIKILGLKRKADNEAGKTSKKRTAFGDITNAIEKTLREGKKGKIEQRPSVVAPLVSKSLKAAEPLLKVGLTKTIGGIPKVEEMGGLEISRKDETSLFDDSVVASSQELQTNKLILEESQSFITASEGSPVETCLQKKLNLGSPVTSLPKDVEDFDLEMKDEPFSVACYAKEIFQYYREREKKFVIDKYMTRQADISKSMRAILVDWMVEVQESFELNHETLYLAVKLVDLYLSKVIIPREKLQLVGSTAIFIACKFDERIPPYIDDFLYICDDAYKRRELVALEIKMLKALQYDLGIPLSYRFLRRYARCGKVPMDDLTFARYILEMSLMEYDLIDASDSLLAAAALYLVLVIKGTSKWSPTLQYYTGFNLDDIRHYVQMLHKMLCQPPKEHLKTIRNKYSHQVFYEVAKIKIPDSLRL